MCNLELKAGERVENISPTLHLLVNDTHRFGTDAMILADFAAPRKGEKVWDLGTGCGILPFLFDDRFAPSEIYAVDISKEAHQLLSTSLKISSPTTSILPLYRDVATLLPEYAQANAQLVVSNPPYFQENTGKTNEQLETRRARHESSTQFIDFAKTASSLLRYGGRFCFCMKPARLAEVTSLLYSVQLIPKRLQFVSNHAIDAPWLFLMEARKNGKNGLTVLPPLFLREEDETYSAEYQRIYRLEKEDTI